MNFFKKALSIIAIFVITFMDLEIIIDYKITNPVEKYNITYNKKTVAQMLDLTNVQPEEVVEVDLTEEENEVEEELQDTIAEEKVEAAPTISETAVEVAPVEESVPEPEVPETPAPESNPGVSGDVVSTALQYVGYGYVSGGASPETGFDCSGFTKYIYGLFGISINRVAGDQAANGTPISKEELQPGDLVLFSYYGSSSIGHSGIYIGDGNFVHAANSSRGVVIDTLESGYYLDNYVTARRLF